MYGFFPGQFSVSCGEDGGTGALWSPDRRKPYHAERRRMMEVLVATSPVLSAGVPRVLFEGNFLFDRPGSYDLGPDGRSFVLLKRAPGGREDEELRVVLDRSSELSRLAPVKE